MNKYRVSELRKEKGWTQEMLAEKSYITVRTIQRLEAGEDVSLDTLTSISNALSVKISDLFEDIEEEEREAEIMDVSKEQAIQIDYRKKKLGSIKLLVIAMIFTTMSILAVSIISYSTKNNIVLFWLLWVSLLLFLIAGANYYLEIKVNKQLDNEYPLTRGVSIVEKEREPIENVWQFIAQYWWIVFPIGGFLSWLIPFLF
ncbi:helix-turn-helix transcriptional regulator [Chryseobacterium sp.]|jgi:transcriptional regulator with XRE-family HTH domain|uniref:helix-turn-helix domain-containing protein n=1 Tax=Chryseobacterium sp. TaxID=1871047 RepID=UPI0025C3AEFA|nr:helix-turn-helix transcriptional regulator [Chryseobacterium sp.]